MAVKNSIATFTLSSGEHPFIFLFCDLKVEGENVPVVWIHDYHLMLAATTIRQVASRTSTTLATIGILIPLITVGRDQDGGCHLETSLRRPDVLDPQSLFGLHVHSCTNSLRPRNLPPSIRI